MPKEVNRRQVIVGGTIFLAGTSIFYTIKHLLDKQKINKYSSMKVEEVKASINTMEEVNWYCNNYLEFEESGEFLKSPRRAHEEKSGDCGERALIAYYLLSDNGYKPTFLKIYLSQPTFMESPLAHLVFYQDITNFGHEKAIKRYAVISDPKLEFYTSLRDIVRSYGAKGYRHLTFDTKQFPDWANTDENINQIFKRLDDIVWLT